MRILIGICLLLSCLDGWRAIASESPNQTKGVSYEQHRIAQVPWSINVIRFDRSQTNLQLTTTLGRGTSIGLSPLSVQVRGVPAALGTPVAAINGDFYRLEHESYTGDPRGLQIMRGELVSAPIDRAAFWVDASGEPHIGEIESDFKVIWPDGTKTPFGLNEEREGDWPVLYTSTVGTTTETYGGIEYVLERVADSPWLPLRAGQQYKARIKEIRTNGQTRLRPDIMVLSMANYSRNRAAAAVGNVVTISTETKPDLAGAQTAIGGGPSLVHQGKARPGYVPKAMERHPRSAFGWNKKEFFFVEVDGRQHSSIGMTLSELANYMVRLGCEEAIGLDGGGSSEVWFNGSIVNSPCLGRERSTANALVVVDKSQRRGSE